MTFWAKTFTYGGVPSQTYNLFVGKVGAGGEISSSAGSGIELITETIIRRPKVYFYGVTQTPVLTFEMSVSSPDEISILASTQIEKWLFGNLNYQKLGFIQGDMTSFYFNSLLTDPTKDMSGNLIKGYTFQVICDSPFGYEYPKTKTLNFATNPNLYSYNFDNLSDDNSYLYPTISFTMDTFGGNLSIKNTSDSDREFIFTGLSANETVTVNNDLQTIVSSTGNYRLSNFNKKWLRFIPNRNSLVITGDIASLSLTYQFAKKIGG